MRPAEEWRYLILAIQREGNRLLADELKPLGVTPSQAEVLRVLEDFGPLSLRGLGDLLVCETGSSPSRLVDRLVIQGLVARRTSEEDARSVTLELTAQGRQLARRVADAENVLHDRLDQLIHGEPEAAARNLLRKLASAFPAGEALARRRGEV
jgi:MarR family transcriptional regulator, organic hydroperoxide resistance regulator